MNFSTLGLAEPLQQALNRLGFDRPTPIQARALPLLLSGPSDFIGLAQTGTGKTAAYGLPLLQRIEGRSFHPQTLVLCPTRELCRQISDDLGQLAHFLPGVRIAAVYGGAGIAEQIRRLRDGAQVVVATPGRALDLMERGVLCLKQVRLAVLDEADEMLRMGFREDLDRILAGLPAGRCIWLFSATMAPAVAAVAQTYLNNPARVVVDGPAGGPAGMAHRCYCMAEHHRYEALCRLIHQESGIRALIFCRTRAEAQTLADRLAAEGQGAEALHGDLAQNQRDAVMARFRSGVLSLLVATDVAARGLDIDEITHVIHYQLPDDPQTYTHRSGRTARAGRAGISLVLATPKEKWRLAVMENRLRLRFEPHPLPTIQTVLRQRLGARLQDLAARPLNPARQEALMPVALEALEGLDREAIIRRLVAAECDRLPRIGDVEDDINARSATPIRPSAGKKASAARKGRSLPRQRTPVPQVQHFCIELGASGPINAGAVVRCICDAAGIHSRSIGAIRLARAQAFFEVHDQVADRVQRMAHKVRLDGRSVLVRPVKAAAPGGLKRPPASRAA